MISWVKNKRSNTFYHPDRPNWIWQRIGNVLEIVLSVLWFVSDDSKNLGKQIQLPNHSRAFVWLSFLKSCFVIQTSSLETILLPVLLPPLMKITLYELGFISVAYFGPFRSMFWSVWKCCYAKTWSRPKALLYHFFPPTHRTDCPERTRKAANSHLTGKH